MYAESISPESIHFGLIGIGGSNFFFNVQIITSTTCDKKKPNKKNPAALAGSWLSLAEVCPQNELHNKAYAISSSSFLFKPFQFVSMIFHHFPDDFPSCSTLLPYFSPMMVSIIVQETTTFNIPCLRPQLHGMFPVTPRDFRYNNHMISIDFH